MRVIFYSQTGTAEDFSKRLAEEAENYGFAPEVVDAEEYDKVKSYYSANLVILTPS